MIRHLPNAITVFRILLVIPIAWLLWVGAYQDALFVVVLAGVSDAVDGAVARRYRATSLFGAYADPLADKLLVSVVFVVLTIQAHIPLWLAIVSIGRDIVILCGAGTYRKLFGTLEVDPTLVSKINTATQLIMLVLVVIGLTTLPYLAAISKLVVDPWGFYAVAILSVISGVDYVNSWSRRAVRDWRAKD